MKRAYIDESNAIPLHSFLKCMMTFTGLKRGKDYVIRANHIRIIKHPIRGKILSTLKECYPEYHYYWETPRILTWFK